MRLHFVSGYSDALGRDAVELTWGGTAPFARNGCVERKKRERKMGRHKRQSAKQVRFVALRLFQSFPGLARAAPHQKLSIHFTQTSGGKTDVSCRLTDRQAFTVKKHFLSTLRGLEESWKLPANDKVFQAHAFDACRARFLDNHHIYIANKTETERSKRFFLFLH